MTMVDEAIIRQRAHAIWEAQGKPDGQHLEHWEQARRELMNGSSTPYTPAVAAAAKAPRKVKAPVLAKKA
jgi:hypothetical protein